MARRPKLGLPLQTLRNAPDAQDGRRLRGGIFEIDPAQIEVAGRLDDRMLVGLDGLKDSIARGGQRVPILVRPLDHDRYGLIYGRRRVEACRSLGLRVRAIVTDMDDDQALRDQLLENQERRDLSFIERAMVAAALLSGDHLDPEERTNKGVAEVLNLTEAGVSQLLGVVRTVGEDLVLAIGAAPGIGRPRWEDLKRAIGAAPDSRDRLTALAGEVRSRDGAPADEASDRAFLAVLAAAEAAGRATPLPGPSPRPALDIPGVGSATVSTGRKGRQFRLDLVAEDKDFVGWLEANAPRLLSDLHERWTRSED